ncbi:MAG: hypothetical protein AAFN93_19270, partial [Bacteroidota bacterium]
MFKYYLWLAFIFCISSNSIGQPSQPDSSTIAPPYAKKIPHQTIFHGDTIIDNYYWMRHKDKPDIINYLSAENGYT